MTEPSSASSLLNCLFCPFREPSPLSSLSLSLTGVVIVNAGDSLLLVVRWGKKRVDDGPDKFMNCSKRKRARVRVFDFGSALRPIQIQTDSANKKEKQESRNVREREEGGFMSPFPNLEGMYI